MKHLYRTTWLLSGVGIVLWLAACQSPEQREPLHLTLLHINDHHSHLEGESLIYPLDALTDAPLLAARTDAGEPPAAIQLHVGGFARLASLFRQEARAAGAVLKLHAGDAITGTPYFNAFQGEADAALMNAICFDAFVPGNHEFDKGDAGLAHFLNVLRHDDCATRIVSANLRPGPASPLNHPPIPPYALFGRNGHTIAVIGLTLAGKTKASSSPDPDTRFLDETTTAQETINALQARGVHHIVLLTHYQYRNDLRLAQQLSGVDIIVGGDSHTLLGDADDFPPTGFVPEGPYPTQAHNRDGDLVCVVQAGEYARVMGRLDVQFDRSGRVIHCDGQPLIPTDPTLLYRHTDNEWRPLPDSDQAALREPLSHTRALRWVTPNEASLKALAPFSAAVDALRQDRLGAVSNTLCQSRLPGEADCNGPDTLPFGSPLATLVVESIHRAFPTADMALINAGSVRGHLYKGRVSRADVQRILPFENRLLTVSLSGAELHSVLNEAVDYALNPTGSSGAYPYASGLRFQVNRQADAGQRVTQVHIQNDDGHWQPIDNEQRYTLVTANYLASGGDGYRQLAASARVLETSGMHYAQPLIDRMRDANAQGQALPAPAASQFSTRAFE